MGSVTASGECIDRFFALENDDSIVRNNVGNTRILLSK